MPRDVGVIVVAAGKGTRIGGEIPKQFLEIGGVPMLLRALRPFTAHGEVAHVVAVLPREHAATPPSWLAGLTDGALSLVAGGAERSDSVAAGLAALPASCLTVLVHDGARPFVKRETIDAVIAVARSGVGAVAAIPLGDTLKEAGASGVALAVLRTIPRARLWRAQTPQGFPRALLERAYARAREGGPGATDDAALVEALGEEVRIVSGSSHNLKITTAEDMELAQLLARRSL